MSTATCVVGSKVNSPAGCLYLTFYFLKKFLFSENSVGTLFENCAQAGLKKLYSSHGNAIGSVPDLCLAA